MKKTSKQLCINRQNGGEGSRLADDRNYFFGNWVFLFVLPRGYSSRSALSPGMFHGHVIQTPFRTNKDGD